jgi:hypothetical protein
MADANKTLLYLSWGDGHHVRQLAFSVLSAVHFLGPEHPGYRIVVYTDRPDLYTDLPVTTRALDAATLEEWAGPHRLAMRRKILAQRAAVEADGDPAVLVDGDTYFLRSPEHLFARVGPGRTVMHVRESSLATLTRGSQTQADIVNLLATTPLHDLAGNVLDVRDPWMWNAGVVGLHPADARLFDEVVHTCDEVCAAKFTYFAEQYAFSYWLPKSTRTSETMDVVFHYWRPYLRTAFNARLDGLIRAAAHLPLPDRAARLYADRPIPPLKRRVVRQVKEALHRVGFSGAGVRSNG